MSQEVVRWLCERGVFCTAPPAIAGDLDYEPAIRLFGNNTLRGCTIGAYTYLSPHARANRATIGRYGSIGDRVVISPSQHPASWLTSSPVTYRELFPVPGASRPTGQFEELRPVTIGHDVWIGGDVSVMGGTTIGDGAIVALGSVVTKDVPPFAIVGGVPAQVIRMRFASDVVERIVASRWWDYDLVRLTGEPVDWTRPEAAIDAIEKRKEDGSLPAIPSTLCRISTHDGVSLSFARLR